MIKTFKSFDLYVRGNAQLGYAIHAIVSDGSGSGRALQRIALPFDKAFELGLDRILNQTADKKNGKYENKFPHMLSSLS